MQNPNSNNLTLAQKGPMQSINYDQILYHINYVKNWAFLLSEWINLQQLGPNNNGKSPEDSHEIEMGIDTPNCETQKLDKFFNQVVLNTNFFKLLNDNVKNMPVFFTAFYYHQIEKDLIKAKKLYKHAFKRAECPKGAF